MLRPPFIKPVAKLLAVLVFALTVASPITAAGHAHHGETDHAAVHSTLECIWMCAASSFVGQDGNASPISLPHVSAADANPSLLLLRDIPQNFRSRAPPTLL